MSQGEQDDRCYFVIHGLPQPMKLKLASSSAFRSLFAAVPLSFGTEGCAFFWNELRLDPNCCPRDYGLSTGTSVVHNIQVRMPVMTAHGASSTPRVYNHPGSSQPTLQDAVNAHLYNTLPPTTFHTMPNVGNKSISGLTQQQAGGGDSPGPHPAGQPSHTYIEELQHAVRYHSECATKVAQELLLAKQEHAEQINFHTAQNAKLLERIEQLEQSVTERDKARMAAAEQSLQSLQQHVFLFESQRQQYQSEIDGLQQVCEELRAENKGVQDRCENLSAEVRQLQEANEVELASHSETEHRLRAQIATLEDDLSVIVGIKETNKRLLSKVESLEGEVEANAVNTHTLSSLEQEVDDLRMKLVQMTSDAVDAKDQHLVRESELLRQLQDVLRTNESLMQQIADLEARIHIPTPTEAQLHAKLREVTAHNQRLSMLIAAPSSASAFLGGNVVPSIVPGFRSQPSPGGTEVAYTHHNSRIDQIVRELSPRGGQLTGPVDPPPASTVASIASMAGSPHRGDAAALSFSGSSSFNRQAALPAPPSFSNNGGMFSSTAAEPMSEPAPSRDAAPPLAPQKSSIKPRGPAGIDVSRPASFVQQPVEPLRTMSLREENRPAAATPTYPDAPPPSAVSVSFPPYQTSSTDLTPTNQSFVKDGEGRRSTGGSRAESPMATATQPQPQIQQERRSTAVALQLQPQRVSPNRAQSMIVLPVQQQQQQQPQRTSPGGRPSPTEQSYIAVTGGSGGGDSASARRLPSPQQQAPAEVEVSQLPRQSISSQPLNRAPSGYRAALQNYQFGDDDDEPPQPQPKVAEQLPPPPVREPSARRPSPNDQLAAPPAANGGDLSEIPLVQESTATEVRAPVSRAKSLGNLQDQSQPRSDGGPPGALSSRGRKLSMHRRGTADPSGGQSIQYAESGVGSAHFEPLHVMFQNAVKLSGDQPALVVEPASADDSEGGATTVTWKTYYDNSLAVGRSLMAQNLAPADSIALIGDKCLQFFYAYVGAVMVGCLPVALQAPNVADHKRVLADLQPTIVFLDSPKGLKGVLGLRNTSPFMKNIVVCRGLIPPVVKTAHRDFVLSWDEFVEKAGWVTGDMVIERQAQIQVENCATVVYTSGCTQQARGVMLSHDSLQFTASSFIDTQDWATQRNKPMRGISHGHLSSIYTQLYDLILPVVFTGLRLGNFCVHVPSVDVTGNLPALFRLIKATRPTLVFGTPDFWELVAVILRGSSTLGKLSSPANNTPTNRAGSAPRALVSPRGITASNEIVNIGLDRCELALWGDRAWKSPTMSYFHEIGFDLLESYGLTECCGLAICSTPTRSGFASCGIRLKGTELRIVRKNERDDVGNGEMLLRGRHVMMGYYRFPSLTKDAIDASGWLHTSDIGQLDEGGLLYFVSRSSEFVQSSKGDNIGLSRIEDGIRSVCPYVSTVVAFGENKDFNICMVYLKTRRDAQTGLPTDDLDAEAAAVNPDIRTTAGARSDKTWQQVIARAIQQYNNGPQCLNGEHKVSRFAFLQSEPAIEGGELCVGSKLRRGAIVEKYHLVLERLYSAGSSSKAAAGGEKPTSPRMTRSQTTL